MAMAMATASPQRQSVADGRRPPNAQAKFPRKLQPRGRCFGPQYVVAGASPADEFVGATSKILDTPRVVGCGGIGIDYLASVATYPKPDEKLRTQALQVQGGGNAGNALTAAARLGINASLLSKIGDDALGNQIIEELEDDGIDTSEVLRARGFPSPFTYIIVDREGGTRTCIHTPSDPLRPEELEDDKLAAMLAGAGLVYFDGRLTEGALLLARKAKEKGIPLLVEAERLRPKLDELLAMADYVTTSSHFPHDWTGEELIGDAMLATLSRLPNARFMVTTLGATGSVMLSRAPAGETQGSLVLQDYLDETFLQVEKQLAQGQGLGPVDTIGAGNVPIRSGVQIASGALVRFVLKRCASDVTAASEAAAEAARRAARNNADFGNHTGYLGVSFEEDVVTLEEGLPLQVTISSAALLDKEAIFDTTGAGDAFNGGLMYGLLTGMAPARMLRLCSLIAAANCTGLGARLALPRRSGVRPEVLSDCCTTEVEEAQV